MLCIQPHPLAAVAAVARRRASLRPTGVEVFFLQPPFGGGGGGGGSGAAAAAGGAHAADAASAKQTRLPPETPKGAPASGVTGDGSAAAAAGEAAVGSKDAVAAHAVAGNDGPHADDNTDADADNADAGAADSFTDDKQQRQEAVPLAYRRFPAVYVHTDHIADLASLYSAADAFVLPSRGEGWGRPHVEAMSMALPVLATNWSGPVEFLDASVGYPIAIEGLETAFGALKWARPSAAHLRRLMRRVVERRGEARALGLRARARMVERYSPAVIARLLEDEFRRIEDAMP